MEITPSNHSKVHYDRLPDTCPICSHGVEPTIVSQGYVRKAKTIAPQLELALLCPRQDCNHIFIAYYSGGDSRFGLRSTAPYTFKPSPIDPKIAEISPMFGKIFGQAEEAERAKLDQIAGMGYRKALEFLIKDYCLSVHPSERHEITSLMLGPVISRWVDDNNVKQCARRAAWLGNDETHYTRKWEGKDIHDLKTLIELTTVWIRSSLLTKEYLAGMPESK